MQKITLDKPLSIEDDEQWDTDEDGLTDWQEVLCKGGLITGNATDGFSLPTYEEYLKIAISVEELEGIEDFFRNKLDSSSYQYVKGFKVLPLLSNPCEVDTDGDYLSDKEEYWYRHGDEVTFDNLWLLIHTSPICVDTDGDGAIDSCDKDPLIVNDSLYNRENAIEYAYKWFDDYNEKEYPNLNDDGADCANFVSQCLFAGGLEMNDDWYMRKHHIWERLYDIISNRAQNWSFEWSLTWTVASEHCKYFECNYNIETYQINREESISDFVLNNPEIQKGDLLYFCKEGSNKEANHATIISEVSDSEIYYAGHTSSQSHRPLSEAILDKNEDNTPKYSHVIIIRISDTIDEVA